MPSRFDRYRIKDGVSRMSEKTFNPIFGDIDVRIAALEAVRVSWEEAVRTVSEYGLARINEIVGPGVIAAAEDLAAIEQQRLAADAALADLGAVISGVEDDALADIVAWKEARLAELTAWKASLESALPAIDSRLTALENDPGIAVVAYADRATLRGGTPEASSKAVVEGLGLFVFYAGSTEPDDDQSCLATSNGRWLLEAAHWDVVDDWISPDLEDLNARWPGRVLFGTAACSITSVVEGTQVSFTGTVSGASDGDRVLVTPPDALFKSLSVYARVTAADTVTIYLNNPSNTVATIAAGIWMLAVIKEV